MKQKDVNYHEKYAEFYQSKRWKLLRAERFCFDEGLCVYCKQKGIIRKADEVHHVKDIEHNWSLRYDFNNLVSLCHYCHDEQHSRISLLQQFLNNWEDL